MYEVEEGSFKLQVELGGDPPDQVENADGWVTVQGEGTWSATFITLAELNRLMNRWHGTGEYLSGAYFICPDLVLLRNPGVDAILTVVRHLVDTGGYEALVKTED
jgi:hypothetical protein